MTELIEGVAVSMIDEDKHSKDDCPFCNSKENEPKPELNDFTHDSDEDITTAIGLKVGIEGYKHKNCAGTLGRAIGGSESVPTLKGVSRSDWKYELEVAYAAHHLIPGHGSLDKSALYKGEEYLRYEGQKAGNIGYNVNCKANGVWLPGNYAYSQKKEGSEWGAKGAKLKEYHEVSAEDYTAEVITNARRQFHDAHNKYNTFVKNQLNKINDKLGEASDQGWCLEGKKRSEAEDEKKQPLYQLVGRLAHLSSRLEKKLTGSTKGWNTNVYTSSFSRQWMLDFNKKIT
ncbi:AHH domain-containing protein [Teredinibacter haidensis]|uniref:AHH domain-containing protein n=1 Tax=Teredinibacter haidensis TaxID=2731755 RepID=UPI000948B53C|nr:AHH domain-containing protein [Teredinibacter haidensis]